MDVNKIKEALMRKLGEGHEVILGEVIKNNDVRRQCITIRANGETMSPTLYPDAFRTGTADEIADEILEICNKHKVPEHNADDIVDMFRNREKMLQNVEYKLVSRERNEEFLKTCPHKFYLDLALIYVVKFALSSSQEASTVVGNEHIDGLGIEIDELDECANRNTHNKGFRFLI